MANISEFKGRMTGGGARANQFRVRLTFPAAIGDAADALDVQFLAKSAQLPASTVGDVLVNFRGRPVHFAGERVFEPWTIEVYTDNNFAIRNAFERWVDYMQHSASTGGVIRPADYQTDMEVIQLDRNENEIKVYKFEDAWPTSIGSIQLDWDDANQVERFPVTFQYNYWTSGTSAVLPPAGS